MRTIFSALLTVYICLYSELSGNGEEFREKMRNAKRRYEPQYTKPLPASVIVKPIVAASVILPVSLCLWAVSAIFAWNAKDSIDSGGVSPFRWLVSIIIPVLIAKRGLKSKSLDWSGAIVGVFVAFFLTLSSYAFFAALLTFYLTSSKATKYQSETKRKIEHDFKEGGQRNWVQVLCNGGVAASLATIYMIESGIGEKPIDFVQDYRSSWLSVAILGALACSNGDTWASELGSVIPHFRPYLITHWKPVPRGTNGGVSFPGLVFSLLGGLVVGVAFYITLILCLPEDVLEDCPPQWPLIGLAALAGFGGSLIDSFLGATVQYSGEDESGIIVESPGSSSAVKHISGSAWLDNHSVNLLSSFITALLLPRISSLLWPQ